MRCCKCRCEGQAWGVGGAGPPATWAFAIFLASDMLFLRLFPGGFATFAFSQCADARYPLLSRWIRKRHNIT